MCEMARRVSASTVKLDVSNIWPQSGNVGLQTRPGNYLAMPSLIVIGRKSKSCSDPVQVATITCKRDGSSTVHLHWFGTKAVEGRPFGIRDDRFTSACASAAWGLPLPTGADGAMSEANRLDLIAFLAALRANGPARWDEAMRKAAFTVVPTAAVHEEPPFISPRPVTWSRAGWGSAGA
jgi:hypothetical protein